MAIDKNRGEKQKSRVLRASRSARPRPGNAEIDAIVGILRSWDKQTDWPLPQNANLQWIWEYSDKHGLGGVIGAMSLSGNVQRCEIAEQARERYFSNILFNEQAIGVCRRIEESASKLNIPIALLKGPALAKQAYADAGLRGYGDLDLFVETRQQALALLEDLQCAIVKEKGMGRFLKRMREPGKILGQLGTWEIEILYLIPQPSDPMHDFIKRNSEELLLVPGGKNSLLDPSPSLHFIFLILHMAVNHFCARLVWMLDLSIFYKNNKERLDIAWIHRELKELELTHLGDAILRFCQLHINDEIPSWGAAEGLRKNGFLSYMLQKETIVLRKLGFQYNHGCQKLFVYIIYIVAFYLIGDSKGWREINSAATRRTTARFLGGFALNNSFLHRIFRFPVYITIRPLSILIDFLFRCRNRLMSKFFGFRITGDLLCVGEHSKAATTKNNS